MNLGRHIITPAAFFNCAAAAPELYAEIVDAHRPGRCVGRHIQAGIQESEPPSHHVTYPIQVQR